MNKHWEDVLSVCFDGASTMSGHLNGVQSKYKEKNNSIMYVHCYAHCLNLALVDSICEKSNSKGKQNRLIFNLLGTVQFIYNFIENSPMRHATLEKVAKETGDKLHTLKSCSNTRWACRAEAVKAIMNNYEVLIIAIENICENCPVPEMRAKGIGLLYQLKTFDFIFGMYMMNPILMLILKVSTLLQEPNLNLVLAMKNVNSLRSTLDSMRNDDSEYKQMFDRSVILCKKHDIAIPDSNSRKVSTRLDSNSSNQAFFNTKFDELKITVFYPLLDKLLSGIDLRFKQDTFDLVDAIACMLNMNLTQKTTKILSTFSKVSEDELITELKLLKNYENAMQLNGASSKSIYEWIDWLKTTGNSTVYTCVFKTLKMFTIIPVTSCTCERVFSKLTIVKNKLRSTMSQERLESLLLLFTEQEIVSKVDLNAVIDEFNNRKQINIIYWHCVESSCKGRIITINRDIKSQPKENSHNHVLDPCKIRCKMAVNNIKEAAVHTQNTAHDIISTVQIVPGVAGAMPSVHHLKHTIRRVRTRNQCTPPIPKTVSDLKISDEYTKTMKGEQFLIFDSGASQDRILIFSTENNLKLMDQSTNWLVDGTFKTFSAGCAYVPPDNVINAYEEILEIQFYVENEDLLMPFLDYFEDNWIGKITGRRKTRRQPRHPIDIWNCHYSAKNGLPTTNNAVEGWNR
ncbi:hypothetical protein QTP88_028654 [Uroleucon formosanum]